MVADLKYALRQLRKSPGFTLTAVLTLALGIGANAAIFSIVSAVLQHPAGVDNPAQVAVLHTDYAKFTLDTPVVSVPDFAAAASLKDVVEAAALEQGGGFNILRDGHAVHISAARVSWQWFQVFGARPILGHTFVPEEDAAGAAPVAMLSYGLWQRAFGGIADVVGQTILLNEKPYRVVGVMGSDFAWPRASEVWVPLALPPSAFDPHNIFNESYQAGVRLRPGVTVQRLTAEWSAQLWSELRRLGRDKFPESAGWSVYATPLTQFAAGPLRRPLYVLSGVVALVLLIAAANVAGLFLARASGRSREIAIRMALGASASRLVRQVFAETALLTAIACAVGVAAGPLAGRLLLRLVPHDLAAGYIVRLQPGVLAVTALAALLSGLIAGMGPALALLRRHNSVDLHGGRSETAGVEKQRLRRAFVTVEVAAAFLLLAGTGLFLASLRKLQQVSPGFNPQGVVAANVPFAGHDLVTNQPRQAAFVQTVVANLASQPGVEAAAAVSPLPFEPGALQSNSFEIRGLPVAAGDPGPHSQFALATPDYLKVMGIPLVAGRWIGPGDLASTEPVVVIDQRLAAKYWPGKNPVGQEISFEDGDKMAVIVGVVGSVRLTSLEDGTSDGMRYYAFAQSRDYQADFVVRSGAGAAAMAPLMKRAVAQADSGQAVSEVVSLETVVLDSLAGRRLIVWLLAAFGGLALLLTMVGLYGLINFLTLQRTREVGIRIALGAQRGQVVWLVLSYALLPVSTGLAAGVVTTLAAGLVLRRVFPDYGVGALPALCLAAGAMLAVGALAAALPARRTATIDPVEALRAE